MSSPRSTPAPALRDGRLSRLQKPARDELPPLAKVDRHTAAPRDARRPAATYLPAPLGVDAGHRRPQARSLAQVREILEDHGLSPFAEIAKVLAKERTERVVCGYDSDGKPQYEVVQSPVIDGAARASVLTELAQYIAPKLRAIEATIKEPELTEAELDARIAAKLQALEALK